MSAKVRVERSCGPKISRWSETPLRGTCLKLCSKGERLKATVRFTIQISMTLLLPQLIQDVVAIVQIEGGRLSSQITKIPRGGNAATSTLSHYVKPLTLNCLVHSRSLADKASHLQISDRRQDPKSGFEQSHSGLGKQDKIFAWNAVDN